MANSIEDHCPIRGQSVCPLKKVNMCSEKFMKGYMGLMKLKTHEALLQGYYWPSMSNDAFQLIQKCTKCQQLARLAQKPSNI